MKIYGRLWKTVSTTILALVLATGSLLAEELRFRLVTDVYLNGERLRAGHYRVVPAENGEVEIHSGRRHRVTVRAEILPLGDRPPNTWAIDSNRTLREIRLDEVVVIFSDESNGSRD